MTDDLRAAFLSATYGTVAERFVLGRVQEDSVSWGVRGRSWGVVTAWNPRGRRVSREENEAAQRALREFVARQGASCLVGVNGEGAWREEALIALDVSLRDVRRWGARFDQAAVLWALGRRVALVWCDGGRVERFWVRSVPTRSLL